MLNLRWESISCLEGISLCTVVPNLIPNNVDVTVRVILVRIGTFRATLETQHTRAVGVGGMVDGGQHKLQLLPLPLSLRPRTRRIRDFAELHSDYFAVSQIL